MGARTSLSATDLRASSAAARAACKDACAPAVLLTAVFGIGGLGHLAVQLARAFGAEVIALDVSEDKLALARELGAATTLNVTDPDALKALRKLGGAHVALVTSAAKAAYDMAFKGLRPGGTLAVVGLPPEALSFQALAIVGST